MIDLLSVLAGMITILATAADHEGKREADMARPGLLKDFKKGPLLLRRVIICGVLVGIMIACFGWRMLWTIPMFWASFTMLHRWRLNYHREMPWWHIDDLDDGGNWYDEAWWTVVLWVRKWFGIRHTHPRQVVRTMYVVEGAVALVFLLITIKPLS